VEGARPLGREDLASNALWHAMWEGKLQILCEKLLEVWTLDVDSLLDLDNLEDVNRPEAGPMSRSHILVQGLDSIGAGELTVLFVHVVSSTARIVADPDAEILDLQGPLLVDHIQRNNLASALLDLSELLEKIPETGFGHDGVGGEEAHAVEFRGRIIISGKLAANDLVFR